MLDELQEKSNHLFDLAKNESKITLRELLGYFGLSDDKEAEKLMKQMREAQDGEIETNHVE